MSGHQVRQINWLPHINGGGQFFSRFLVQWYIAQNLGFFLSPSISPMLLTVIVISTSIASAVALALASWVSLHALVRFIRPLINFSIGTLLGVALLHSMPEAFHLLPENESVLFALFLGAILTFFLLEKFSVLRHSHHFEADGHNHEKGFDQKNAGRDGNSILVGDAVHNYVDGALIASAYMLNWELGFITTIGIVAHEIPQKTSNFIVLLNAGVSKARAYRFNLLSASMSIIGGISAYVFIQAVADALPYLLVVNAAVFVYVALSDLMPQSQYQSERSDNKIWQQVLLIALGLGLVLLSVFFAHPEGHDHHDHDHDHDHAALILPNIFTK